MSGPVYPDLNDCSTASPSQLPCMDQFHPGQVLMVILILRFLWPNKFHWTLSFRLAIGQFDAKIPKKRPFQRCDDHDENIIDRIQHINSQSECQVYFLVDENICQNCLLKLETISFQGNLSEHCYLRVLHPCNWCKTISCIFAGFSHITSIRRFRQTWTAWKKL